MALKSAAAKAVEKEREKAASLEQCLVDCWAGKRDLQMVAHLVALWECSMVVSMVAQRDTYSASMTVVGWVDEKVIHSVVLLATTMADC